jgi:hypothetical protein
MGPAGWFKILNPEYTQRRGRAEMVDGFKERRGRGFVWSVLKTIMPFEISRLRMRHTHSLGGWLFLLHAVAAQRRPRKRFQARLRNRRAARFTYAEPVLSYPSERSVNCAQQMNVALRQPNGQVCFGVGACLIA